MPKKARRKGAHPGALLGHPGPLPVMIEGPSQKEITAMANELADTIKKNMK